MSENIAKRYVKALLKSIDSKKLKNVSKLLKSLVPAYSDEKFIAIMESRDVSAEAKENFILSLLDTKDSKIINFIKVLSQNGRLNEIPHIVKELEDKIAQNSGEYNGKIISNFVVSDNKRAKIEKNLSKKFDAKIKLDNIVTDYPGIKVEVESLGVEVSFSSDRLKAQITEHILKAL